MITPERRMKWREQAAPNPQARRGYRERDARIIALLDQLEVAEARVARVAALLAGYDAWTGEDPFDEFASSPKQRDQLRAALRDPEPTWHAHTGCARHVEGRTVHYTCGISVERGDYEGGVYAEHVRRAEAAARPEHPCCPGRGTMAHVRGCVNHPEADRG